MTAQSNAPSLLVFGGGYVGAATARAVIAAGGTASATSRDPARREDLKAEGITPINPADRDALNTAVAGATAIVITAAPDAEGCPGARALIPALSVGAAWPDWIGYLSSTAVYGDRNGGWVFEGDALNAASVEGARRVRAESDWLDAGRGMGLTVQVFRLPGIYGPGRSAVDRLRDGTARLVRKPGQVFNRIHVEDIVSGLIASMARPRPGGIYNLADDAPAPADEVIEWAARRMGLPVPEAVAWTDPSVSLTMRRFYLDSKRVSNARAKGELDWRPAYPTWREGLEPLI